MLLPKIIRVMTYNIHHGAGLDGKVDIERIGQVILQEKADLVALQEVDRGVERSHRVDTMGRLSDLTGMAHAFGKNIDYQGGDYGNGVLTRFPILREQNLPYRMLRPDEQRGLLHLVLDVDGYEMIFMNTHIDYRPDDTERVSNISEIRELARYYAPHPVITCGDFNTGPDSRTIALMKESFSDVWELVGKGGGATFPSDQVESSRLAAQRLLKSQPDKPKKRIDYIFLVKDSQPLLKPLSTRVVESDASDHLPVIAEFQLCP